MTKENMKKLLEEPHYDLRKIFFDEARKVEKDDADAQHLADEAYASLSLQLERSSAH